MKTNDCLDLSVIVVSWNTRQLLHDCLTSIRIAGRDSKIATEVIVVDNGSEDDSAELVRSEFPEVTLIASMENMGFSKANNMAMAVARGRHVLLLNSDTIVHGEVLDRSVALLDQSPRVGAMGCKVLNSDGSEQRSASRFPGLRSLMLMTIGMDRSLPEEPIGSHPNGRSVEVLSGCYLMVRREAIEQVGGLDDSFFFFGEDSDWCLRLRRAGWRLVHAPVGTITHFGGGSATRLKGRRDLLLTGAFIRLQRKHFGLLAAGAMWALLLCFNMSRSTYWSIASISSCSEDQRLKSRHFREILAGYHRVWGISKSAGHGANELKAAAVKLS